MNTQNVTIALMDNKTVIVTVIFETDEEANRVYEHMKACVKVGFMELKFDVDKVTI